MEIKLERFEYLQERLARLKCSQGCQGSANYIIYDLGLLCTLCLSRLPEAPPTHLASLEQLAKALAELADQYEHRVRTGAHLAPLKAEGVQTGQAVKGLRDSVTLDAKAIHSKATQRSASALHHCLNQSRNEPLENFFEPDLTASAFVKETQLFLDNLRNLKVVEEGGAVVYEFREPQKDPEEAKQAALRELQHIRGVVNDAQRQTSSIMERFRRATK